MDVPIKWILKFAFAVQMSVNPANHEKFIKYIDISNKQEFAVLFSTASNFLHITYIIQTYLGKIISQTKKNGGIMVFSFLAQK